MHVEKISLEPECDLLIPNIFKGEMLVIRSIPHIEFKTQRSI